MENCSEHPIAVAIVKYVDQWLRDLALTRASMLGLEATDFASTPGQGVQATVSDGASLHMQVLVGNRSWLSCNSIKIPACYDAQIRDAERQGKTVVLCAVLSHFAGYVVVQDSLKEDAAASILALQDLGIFVSVLTGDNQRTAEAIVGPLGMSWSIWGGSILTCCLVRSGCAPCRSCSFPESCKSCGDAGTR